MTSRSLMLGEIGVTRAIIGTQALKQPDWFRKMVEKYPNRIALGLDARDSMVATAGWLDVSKTPAIDLARQYQGLPLAALIYTNIANDGMMQGVDRRTIDDMLALAQLGFPIIASGGVTTIKDIEALAHEHASSRIWLGRSLVEPSTRERSRSPVACSPRSPETGFYAGDRAVS